MSSEMNSRDQGGLQELTNEQIEIAKQILEEQDKVEYDSDGYDVNDPFR